MHSTRVRVLACIEARDDIPPRGWHKFGTLYGGIPSAAASGGATRGGELAGGNGEVQGGRGDLLQTQDKLSIRVRLQHGVGQQWRQLAVQRHWRLRWQVWSTQSHPQPEHLQFFNDVDYDEGFTSNVSRPKCVKYICSIIICGIGDDASDDGEEADGSHTSPICTGVGYVGASNIQMTRHGWQRSGIY